MQTEPALAHVQPGVRASVPFACIPADPRAFALPLPVAWATAKPTQRHSVILGPSDPDRGQSIRLMNSATFVTA